MRSKRVLMVTTAFPYGQGEAFVKAELEHISKCFAAVELVPSYCADNVPPRTVNHDVNLTYATMRWGVLRVFHVIGSFAKALLRYQWGKDALHILTNNYRYTNAKELVRALYRAQLFQSFLEREIIKNEREFDLIYFYWLMPEIMGAVGFRDNTKQPIKIVARAHGGDLYEERKPGGYAGLRRGIAAGIDEIFCISGHGKAYLDSEFPVLREKFHVAYLGVDDPGYLNVQPRDGHLSIVSCSFVIASKRLQLIVEAIACLLERDPLLNIKWTHIGDGELYEQLRTLVADRLSGRANVVFTGYLTPTQVMNLYRDEGFDVVVNVSDVEGIPVSLMEASSVGIPMIATDVGGNGEIVDAANGILISADSDVETIAAALLRFKDRALASAYRKAARLNWEQKFNAQKNYGAFGESLLHLLNRPAKVSPGSRGPLTGERL